jgi:hypothetical protein
MVGLDLSGTISFECEGGNEITKTGDGLGTKREIVGSVIGRIVGINNPATSFEVTHEVKHSAQFPEKFEGQGTDTLAELVGTEKTPEAAWMVSKDTIQSEVPIEIKAKCKGAGC